MIKESEKDPRQGLRAMNDGSGRERQQILGVFERPVASGFGIQNGDFRDSICRVTNIDTPAMGNILDDGFIGELNVEDVVLVIVLDSHAALPVLSGRRQPEARPGEGQVAFRRG
jgi:hypothetical protein